MGRRWNQDPKPNPSISNYACFANNPIWFSDPLGDTVLIGIAKNAASGNGHMGMAYQNGVGEWFYFSQGATDNPKNPGAIGMILGRDAEGGIDGRQLTISETKPVLDTKGNPVLDAAGNPVTTTVLRNPTKDEVAAGMKNGVFGYKYDDLVQLNTTAKQDRDISRCANSVIKDYKPGNDNYGLYFNNCVDACQEAIQSKSDISLPMDWSPVPNSYFEKLKVYEKEFNKKP